MTRKCPQQAAKDVPSGTCMKGLDGKMWKATTRGWRRTESCHSPESGSGGAAAAAVSLLVPSAAARALQYAGIRKNIAKHMQYQRGALNWEGLIKTDPQRAFVMAINKKNWTIVLKMCKEGLVRKAGVPASGPRDRRAHAGEGTFLLGLDGDLWTNSSILPYSAAKTRSGCPIAVKIELAKLLPDVDWECHVVKNKSSKNYILWDQPINDYIKSAWKVVWRCVAAGKPVKNLLFNLVMFKRKKLLKKLIEMRPDVDPWAPSDTGDTLFHQARTLGILKYLLTLPRAFDHVNDANEDGNTPVHNLVTNFGTYEDNLYDTYHAEDFGRFNKLLAQWLKVPTLDLTLENESGETVAQIMQERPLYWGYEDDYYNDEFSPDILARVIELS